MVITKNVKYHQKRKQKITSIYINIFTFKELLELNCLDETKCQQFQHSGIKSTCIEEQCQCTSSNGDPVKCQPLVSKF